MLTLHLRRLAHHEVETGVGLYTDLAPHKVDRSADEVFAALERYARAQPGWRAFRVDAAAHELRCECVTRIFHFVDDLRVWVVANADGRGAVVHAHSKSRVGTSDLGANARRIRALFKALG